MDDMHLEMQIEGFYCNSWPKLTIKQNSKTIYEEFVENLHTIDMQIENKPFSIGMENKLFGTDNVWDTVIDADGNIITDKYLAVKKISLDGANFENNLYKLPYQSIEHGPTMVHDQTICFNGHWQINAEGNPYDWIIDLLNKKVVATRKISYFSDYESHGNYEAHQTIIDEIKQILKI